jgi:hypothetical protein
MKIFYVYLYVVKYIVSIFVIAILIFQSGVNTFFVLNYHSSLEAYEAACVNKDKPEMKCHGKCKMLEETKKYGFLEDDNDSAPSAPVLKSMKNIDLFYSEYKNPFIIVFSSQLIKKMSSKVCNYSVLLSIPHPPPQLI